MNKIRSGAILCLLFLSMAFQSVAHFKDAVAVWNFKSLDDKTKENSRLSAYGNVLFVKMNSSDAQASRVRGGDGVSAQFNGGWLAAGDGANNELALAGKTASFLIRVKPNNIKGFVPLIGKDGNAQSVAYRVALYEENGNVFVEALIGNDHVTGAHQLKYKLPKETINEWHDIVFRFNGKIAQLYVNGVLGDQEVVVGEIRDWNQKPFLIGAQLSSQAGYATLADKDVAFKFDGLMDHVVIWNRYITDKELQEYSGVKELTDGRPTYYGEKYRPQFHFSARRNGLNDPNGLVYYNGVYHLFFQHWGFPYRPVNNKDWGHAISTDLIHWQQTDDHITPHKIWGGAWSGSAVVDENNVAGFQTDKEKPIIAFITNIGAGDTVIGGRFTQCIAYSTDGGKTFTYYDQNPIIRNISDGNRDPKVVWDEGSQKWIMSLFMKDNDYAIFSSANLKEWQHLETLKLEGVSECPGFEPFAVDGDSTHIKWIFFGANGNYIIGSFDGKYFTPETSAQRGDYGSSFYAAQTWSNAPDGRSLHIAWMASQQYPDMPFSQQMTFPTEMTLRTTKSGIKAFRLPVREIANLYDKTWSWNDRSLTKGADLFKELTDELYDIDIEIDVKTSSLVEMKLRNVILSYDVAKQTLSLGGSITSPGIPAFLMAGTPNYAPLNLVDGKIKLRILLDRTSVEIFGNDGEMVMTSCYMPEQDERNYSLTANSDIHVVRGVVNSLKPAWLK